MRLAGGAVFLRRNQLFKLGNTRLGLGLATLWPLPDPVQLFFDGFLTTRFLAVFLLKPLCFLFEIGRIIAFVREIFPAIELKNPIHHIIKEVAIVGDHQHSARIFLKVRFKPFDAFGVQMVGRFVEQQDRWLLDQQTGERDPALFAARQIFNGPIRRRAPQRLHGDFQLIIERPAIHGINPFLQRAHFFHQRIKISIRLTH